MTVNTLTLSLDTGWTCSYHQRASDPRGPARAEAVASLAAWARDQQQADSPDAWLERSFTLRQVDYCVSYLLLIDSAPAGAEIHINGKAAGLYHPPGLGAPPFELDITLLVTLGANRLAFRVAGDLAGAFSGVRLRLAPCAA
ncbi:MAG: hypothetical protein BroJett033_4660 [Chloroflexota bacterium]|nr:MAG: hypothetical protein BroJett033_4660 [Chloroflexota bacterium]